MPFLAILSDSQPTEPVAGQYRNCTLDPPTLIRQVSEKLSAPRATGQRVATTFPVVLVSPQKSPAEWPGFPSAAFPCCYNERPARTSLARELSIARPSLVRAFLARRRPRSQSERATYLTHVIKMQNAFIQAKKAPWGIRGAKSRDNRPTGKQSCLLATP